ncbi:MAG: DegT/DnrJ/EryC1/StrS family aminotransferase [Algoriphagus sp.]
MEQELKKIWLSSPHMSGREYQYVTEAFETNWIAPVGPHLGRFEEKISKLALNYSAAALSSGTAAIHLGLILADVGPGDVVICQSLTFSASANPIKYLGAHPVFVDSEMDTMNMCPSELENAIKASMDGVLKNELGGFLKAQLPKAIIPVHLYGMPAKMNEISAIGEKYGIPILEDAAEAIGSSLDGRPCGTFGKFGVFSFNGNKIITTSGGGALVSSDDILIQRARFLSTQARENAVHYEHKVVGYNYRLSNVSAAIGLGQMEALPDRVNQRRANFEFYKRELGSISGIGFLAEPEGFFSNRWLTTIMLDPVLTNSIDRETLRLGLEKFNIESRPIWKPMHLQPIFENAPFFGINKNSDRIFENGLCLPSGSNLTTEDLDFVVDKIKKMFG